VLDRDLIEMRINILGINTSQLSPLAQIPPAKLSQFLSGTRGLNNSEIERLRGAINDVEQLVQVARPFPLSFRNVELIRELLRRMKDGEFDRVLTAKEQS
jgi:hypothetical protein